MEKGMINKPLSVTICAIVLFILSSTTTQAATISYTVSLPQNIGPDQYTGYMAGAAIPQFDTALGSLEGVTVQYDYGLLIDYLAGANVTCSNPYSPCRAILNGGTITVDMGIVIAVDKPFRRDPLELAAQFDRTTSYGGFSCESELSIGSALCRTSYTGHGRSFGTLDATASGLDLMLFTDGQDQLWLYENMVSTSVLDCPSGQTCFGRADGTSRDQVEFGRTSTFTVTYDYQVVPVPPAVWLFGSGLIGLIGVARRK